MLKDLPINFIKQAIEQTLFEEHLKNIHFFGGQDQIALHSFYEQLQNQNEVDRFVETYRDLSDQQNRTGLIGNGVLLSPENPTMTNLYSALIIPYTWTCSVRCTLENRDDMIWTLQNMIDKLKGRKCDIAQLECEDEQGRKIAKLFKVGTMGQGAKTIKSGDFIGGFSYNQSVDTQIKSLISNNTLKGLTNSIVVGDYLYFEKIGAYGQTHKVCVAQYQYNQKKPTPTITSSNITVEPFTSDLGGTMYRAKLNVILTCDDVPNDYQNLNVHLKGKATETYGVQTLQVNFDKDATINSATLNNGTLTIDCSASLVVRLYEATYSNLTFDTKVTYNIYEWVQIDEVEEYTNVVFPQEHDNFEKYKLSMSFESFRIDEPQTLNSQEYCTISFGGSATLVNASVKLGNDLVGLDVQKNKIIASSIVSLNGSHYYLEPMEMPSGLNANTQISQLMSNNFKQNTHTDGTSCILQYTFICDENIEILEQWFDYARFGTYGITNSYVSPNMIYNLIEYWSSWGNVRNKVFQGKIVESIDIENTESDVLTLGLTFQLQGANN